MSVSVDSHWKWKSRLTQLLSNYSAESENQESVKRLCTSTTEAGVHVCLSVCLLSLTKTSIIKMDYEVNKIVFQMIFVIKAGPGKQALVQIKNKQTALYWVSNVYFFSK